jgi:transposase-like protein
MKRDKPQKVQRIYEAGFKIAVARAYLESKLGYIKIGRKYGISSGSVCNFVKWYKKNYPEHSLPTSIQRCIEVDDKSVSKELKLAYLKIASLEMLIEIAKKELDIDIIKKFGTKPPLK